MSKIKPVFDDIVKETSTSGAAGSYLTKDVGRKKKKQDISSPTGFESSPNPNMYTKTMKFKIVKPNARLNSKDLWESRYSQFKKSTTKQHPKNILHKAIKQIQYKLDEVNRLIEFTTRIKGELTEGENEIEYLKRTKDSIFNIQEKLKQALQKISLINKN